MDCVVFSLSLFVSFFLLRFFGCQHSGLGDPRFFVLSKAPKQVVVIWSPPEVEANRKAAHGINMGVSENWGPIPLGFPFGFALKPSKRVSPTTLRQTRTMKMK